MKNVLLIRSSINGTQSFSNRLADAIVDRLKDSDIEMKITVRDVSTVMPAHLSGAQFHAFMTPPENHTPEEKISIAYSDMLVGEITAADTVIIAAPMYQFTIPSTLKAWFDNIARAGKTFRYSANGPEGLLKNKKVYLAISSGGVYSSGPMKSFDFIEGYLRAVLGFLGMTDVTTFRAEGTAMPDLKETALQKAIDSIAV